MLTMAIKRINWNLLGDGLHLIEVFVGDTLLGSARVLVGSYNAEFLSGIPNYFWVMCRNTVADTTPRCDRSGLEGRAAGLEYRFQC